MLATGLNLALLSAISFNAMAECRDSAVKHHFDVINGYPHGRKGYVVDHVCALAVGGIDDVSNMQYQTFAESKKKDKIENTPEGRLMFCNEKNSTPTRKVFNCR